MTTKSLFGFLLLSGLISFASVSLVGCGDSEDAPASGGAGTSSGGSAGSAGSGGGAAGSAGASAGSGGSAGAAGGAAGAAGSGGGAAGAGGGAAGGKPKVRVAHMSPDAPAVDVCIKEKSAAAFGDAATKGSSGLKYPQVSQYFELAKAGDYTAIVIAAGGKCEGKGLVGELPLAAADGKAYTIMASGPLTALKIDTLADAYGKTDGKALVRPVHAAGEAPAVNVAALVGGNPPAIVLIKNLAYADKVAKAGPIEGAGSALGKIVDGGYIEAAVPVSDTTKLQLQTASDGKALKNYSLPTGVSVGLGTVATIFAHGKGADVQLFACVDSAPAAGGLSTCVATKAENP